ncbi:hypothetical protein GCM10011614_22800 [Novosphingobium colocasiae]|uniref:Uncharacterized protein n=1 Tax=Novosphingobium colocasiae TaxID=1256513 RepID=A0A918UH65_9SPHN|nr:hypothetical protein GCM10011614_22800 [Novosphingobium colocasiae]
MLEQSVPHSDWPNMMRPCWIAAKKRHINPSPFAADGVRMPVESRYPIMTQLLARCKVRDNRMCGCVERNALAVADRLVLSFVIASP